MIKYFLMVTLFAFSLSSVASSTTHKEVIEPSVDVIVGHPEDTENGGKFRSIWIKVKVWYDGVMESDNEDETISPDLKEIEVPKKEKS